MRLKLAGTRGNRDAIGAWIQVKTSEGILTRQVMPAKGYLSSSELPVTIGLGNADPEAVEIIWPGGKRQALDHVPLNQLVVVREE
jgi:enediyne biosynthesis protein E4